MRRLPLLLLPVLAACGPQAVSIDVVPRVGAQAFSCTASYPGVGVGASAVQPLDFRLYVSAVTLLRADGTSEPLVLTPGDFQRDGVALLDFENATGTCLGGTSVTHTTLSGTVARPGPFTGLAFDIGVPPALNHLNSPNAEAPFNAPGLWWSWTAGFKFLRADLKSAAVPVFNVHLGSTTCSGQPPDPVTCQQDNRVPVRLEVFDATSQSVVMDLGALFSEANVDAAPVAPDSTPGCMSGVADPDCAPLFKALGLPFGGAAASTQRFVKAEAK